MPRPFAKADASPAGTWSGVSPRFFQWSISPASTRAGQRFSSMPLGFEQLLEQPDLVVDVEDGEVALQPDQLGVAAQDFHADGVEGAEPRHALDRLADHRADAVLHLAGGLVGEGHGEDFGRPRPAGREDVGDAGGQHPRLAGAGAGQHQHRAVQGLDRLSLLGVQVVQIAAPRPPARPWRARRCRPARAPEPRRGRLAFLAGSAKAKPVHENHGQKMALAA